MRRGELLEELGHSVIEIVDVVAFYASVRLHFVRSAVDGRHGVEKKVPGPKFVKLGCRVSICGLTLGRNVPYLIQLSKIALENGNVDS